MEKYATTEECQQLRKELISKGYIKRSKHISKRNKLIRRGIIVENIEYPKLRTKHIVKGEGEYKVKKIRTNKEYNHKKELYFWMLSDILRVRRELKLELGNSSSKDPKWYF